MNYGYHERQSLVENKFKRKNASLLRLGTFTMKSLVTILSIAMLFSNAIADDVRVLHEEELISDIHLNPKEFAYYHLKVTSRIYKGEDHLTISAFATSFNSDPDIYISRVSRSSLLR